VAAFGSLDVETHSPQLRKQVPGNDVFEVIQALCLPLELTTKAVMTDASQRPDAVEHLCDGGFDGSAAVECVAQFGRRTTHVSIRVRAQFLGETFDPSEDDFDLLELDVQELGL
jgi:hypothetical protein